MIDAVSLGFLEVPAQRRLQCPGAFQVAIGGRQPRAEDIVAKSPDVLIAQIGVVGQAREIPK